MTLMSSTLAEQVPTSMIMLGVICAIGCIGNTIVIIVYSTKHDRMTANVFILALAMVDMFACICLMPLTIYIESVEWRISSEFLCKLYYIINNSFIPFSSLLISAIAFDRYFCICHPFLKIITITRAKQIIFALLVIALVHGGISSVCVVLVQHRTPLNKTEYECTETRMLNTSDFDMAIYYALQRSQISSYVFCILSVAILYILIFRSVLIMREKRVKLIGLKLHRPVQNTEGTSRDDSAAVVSVHPQEKGQFDQDNGVVQINNIYNSLTAPISEQSTVAEIWRNRLKSIENRGDAADSIQDVAVTKVTKPTDDRRSISFKVNKHTKSSIQKRDRSHYRRISARGLKNNAILLNMKTAGMLCVVAIVFIISLIPAMLMAVGVIQMYLPVFYMYYVNNGINPIIYCFMNPNFREDVRNFFIVRSRIFQTNH